jgi:hypothetical protein
VFSPERYEHSKGSPQYRLIIRLKYNDGVPEGSRMGTLTGAQFTAIRDRFSTPEGKAELTKVKELSELAQNGISPL